MRFDCWSATFVQSFLSVCEQHRPLISTVHGYRAFAERYSRGIVGPLVRSSPTLLAAPPRHIFQFHHKPITEKRKEVCESPASQLVFAHVVN